MRVAREEIFGPVITILKYTDLDEAITLANNTEFGLDGIVFGNDQDRALGVAEAMNTGSVGINFFASNHAAPLRWPKRFRSRRRIRTRRPRCLPLL